MCLRYWILAGMFVALGPSIAAASTFTVGAGGGGIACDYTTVQAAVDAARAQAGADEIRVSVATGGYTNQAIVVRDLELTISGGYATCAASVPTGHSILSGAGGAAAAVLTIDATSEIPVNIQLDHLDLIDGDNSFVGGGLFIQARGTVRISDSRIANNRAQSGGGIAINGGAGDLVAELVVADNVQIENNIANSLGGGVYVVLAAFRLGGVDTIVRGNRAAAGGGIALVGTSDCPCTSADIRSGGLAGEGIISNNQASNGGGIYATAFSQVRLFTTDTARPVRIDHNTATGYAGGVYSGGILSRVSIWEGILDANTARFGAGAIYADAGGRFFMAPANHTSAPAGTLPCPASTPCNQIINNSAADGLNPTPGAIAIIKNNDPAAFSEIYLASANLVGNTGSTLFADLCFAASCDNPMTISILDSRIVANADTPALVEISDHGWFNCDFCTIASLGSSSAPLFDINGVLSLRRSILWAPGRDVIGEQPPLSIIAQDLLLHDRTDFPPVDFPSANNIDVGDPRFVAQASDDFRLQANSPALDRTPALDIPEYDLDGNPRAVDQADIPDNTGPVDLGAYERAPPVDAIFVDGFE